MVRRKLVGRLSWGGGAWLVLAALPALARAQTAAEPASENVPADAHASIDNHQRHLGVLLSVGQFIGFGGGLQLGAPELGIRASMSWSPVFYGLQDRETADSHLRWFPGYQVEGDAYLRAMTTSKGASVGVVGGYRYHRWLGHGGALGGYFTFPLHRVVDLLVEGGFLFYPHAEDRLRAERAADIPDNSFFEFPGANVLYGISAGLVLFP